jgi:DNA mismatch repair protein MutL
MDIIKLLPDSLSNKIAAGEVVNRPESVVKELIENSIDAGADRICLILKDAGKNVIKVIDNGSGMSESDALSSLQRHTTSKIYSYEDLENISTLGFRGEALASISSISHLELRTRKENDELGTFLRVEGGKVVDISKISCDKGTSVTVKNLFYNTPARRNFLKSDHTEYRHIYETFIRLAISHPEKQFEFINNEVTVFNLKNNDLKGRIGEIFTKDLSDSLIDLNFDRSLLKINGLISKPNFTKKAKQDQYFYLNNRFFCSRNFNYAVYMGYGDLIDKGDYPSFFLFLDTDPSKVDVNVHPSKMEVKFEDESAVFGCIVKAVKESLQKSDLIFGLQFNNTLSPENINSTFSFDSSFSSASKIKIESYNENEILVRKDSIDTERLNISKSQNIFLEEIENVWQYNLKYILWQKENELVIIDQHAAHERILYEKAFNRLNSQAEISQSLIESICIDLSPIDYEIICTLIKELKMLGFEIKTDNMKAEITAVPSDIKPGNEIKIIKEIIDQYKEYELSISEYGKINKRDNLAKSYACKRAIKTGDKLTTREMQKLIEDLFNSEMPYVCPHGRPTIIKIASEELDKRFSRT